MASVLVYSGNPNLNFEVKDSAQTDYFTNRHRCFGPSTFFNYGSVVNNLSSDWVNGSECLELFNLERAQQAYHQDNIQSAQDFAHFIPSYNNSSDVADCFFENFQIITNGDTETISENPPSPHCETNSYSPDLSWAYMSSLLSYFHLQNNIFNSVFGTSNSIDVSVNNPLYFKGQSYDGNTDIKLYIYILDGYTFQGDRFNTSRHFPNKNRIVGSFEFSGNDASFKNGIWDVCTIKFSPNGTVDVISK